MRIVILFIAFILTLTSCSTEDKSRTGSLGPGSWDKTELIDTDDYTNLNIGVTSTSGCCDHLMVIVASASTGSDIKEVIFPLTTEIKTKIIKVPANEEIEVSFTLALGPCLCIETSTFDYELTLE